ncbi:eIF5-mimic protein 2-like [Mytilus galloprovincialis]|uniref:W2 domain-containing protein n=1 Tax=Mytilus galloprovincialis TaxID=29158 RepID=A0A8B6D9H8_MYTGA|nr:Hypothetical predicted protein [Mytilus galloprovincialis]
MSQKAEKPSLSGTRLKTRKRDEKEKYDPSLFRDAIIAGLNETDGDLDLVSKYLDTAGAKLDYRRYADVLFDILVAGGQLAPGGSIVEDPDPNKLSKTHVCVFGTEESIDKLKAFYDIFYKLLRRYKYLEKSFEETFKKLILFLKGYHESDQRKLAIITGVFLATGFCSAKVLSNLFEDHLVKDGLSLDFATMMFRVWLEERDILSINGALKKAQLDTRLLELFPLNKRSLENFVVHFEKAELSPIADMQKAISTSGIRKNVQKQLGEMIKDEESVEEMLRFIQEQIRDNSLNDSEITTMVWNTIMAAVEWNKKEELVADQAMKHIKIYCPLLATVAKSGKAELTLMVKIQDYCYGNVNFMKSFQKIIVMLYKSDVLSEDAILKWYKEGHSTKGKSTFLEQMKKFIEWLEQAEEESEEDD